MTVPPTNTTKKKNGPTPTPTPTTHRKFAVSQYSCKGALYFDRTDDRGRGRPRCYGIEKRLTTNSLQLQEECLARFRPPETTPEVVQVQGGAHTPSSSPSSSTVETETKVT
eukprot:149730_1